MLWMSMRLINASAWAWEQGRGVRNGDIDPTHSKCLIDDELDDQTGEYSYSGLDQVLGDKDAHVSGDKDVLGLEDGKNPDDELEYKEL